MCWKSRGASAQGKERSRAAWGAYASSRVISRRPAGQRLGYTANANFVLGEDAEHYTRGRVCSPDATRPHSWPLRLDRAPWQILSKRRAREEPLAAQSFCH